jgi:hypothetical protein
MSAVAPYRNPLDVLWRGVPTPFRAEVQLARRCVAVETNDPALLAQFPVGTVSTENAAQTRESDFLWRIVRDEEAPGTVEPCVAFAEGPLTFVAMGSSLTVAVDHERNELIAFVGRMISHTEFAATALPLFEKLTLGGRGSLDPAAHHKAGHLAASQDADYKNA